LDIVLRDKKTKKILIIDFKTSSYGWNVFMRKSRLKLDQLLLYKRFYSMQHGVPLQDIDIVFFIMKRKLYEGLAFPQQRIQRIVPPSGKLCMSEVEKTFSEFINECFTLEGEFNREHRFLKNPDKGRKNCKYCPFKTLIDPKTGEKYCDGKQSE